MKSIWKISILVMTLVIFIAACSNEQKDEKKSKKEQNKADEIENTYMLKKNDENKQDETTYENYKDPFTKDDLNAKKTALKDKDTYKKALKAFDNNVRADKELSKKNDIVKYKGKDITPKYIADSGIKGGYDVMKNNFDKDVQEGERDDFESKSFGTLQTPLSYQEIENAELYDAKYLSLARDNVSNEGKINENSAKYEAKGYSSSPFATSEKDDGFGLWWVGRDTTDAKNITGKHIKDVPEHGGVLHVKMNYGNDSNKKVKIKDVMNLSYKSKEIKPDYVRYQNGSESIEDKYENIENDTTQHSKVNLDLYYIIDEDMRSIKEPFYSITPLNVDAPLNKKYEAGIKFEPVEIFSNMTGEKAAEQIK